MSTSFKFLKRILSNPRMIFAYLNSSGLLNIFSDKAIIKLLWWVRTGTNLNLKSPITFNEKIQWIKLNYRDPKMTMMVDKYLVRNYISSVIGEEYLIPLINVWNSPREIDFTQLPEQYVLKCNHNAAVGLYLCRSKNTTNRKKVISNLKIGQKKNFYFSSREWAYKNVQRKIICEKYMEDGSGKGLRDYKFFCFNGKAEFIYISEGLENHDTAFISFYDLEGNELPFHRSDYKPFDQKPSIPSNFIDMVKVANRLAEDINFPFVRIDLYSILGKTYFSEITFYPNSGFIPFEPAEWDAKLGEKIDLSLFHY